MKKFLPTVACAFFLTAGIAQAQVVVRIGPPARPHEVIPPLPPEHRDWAWHAGYHRWDGNRYVWVPGTYMAPPRPRARWVEGRWVHRGGGWVWTEGRWR
jgi:WXXGXW repeat (2 copies)